MAANVRSAPGPQPSPTKTGPPPALSSPVMTGPRLIVTASACLISVFLDQATNGATSAAVRYIEGSTGVSVDQGRWITSVYLMPYFVLLLVTPYLIGRYGRRWVWMSGHIVFAAASLGCAASSDAYGALLFWRFFQGLAQGTFFVCAVSTVLTIFPPQIAFLGFAIFAGTSLSGAASASAVGGYFVDTNQWTTLFVVLALLAVVAGITVRFTTPDTAPIVPRVPFDGFGVALASISAFAFMYIAQFGERDDWFTSPAIVGFLVVLVVAVGAFVAWEGFFARQPFLDLRLFGFHNLRWGTILGIVLGVPLFGATTLVQYLETSLQFSSSLAGGELALRIATIVLFVPAVAYTLNKKLLDPRVMIVPGFLFVAISYVLQYFGTTSTAWFATFVPSILFSGAGFALLFSPIASSILGTLPQTLFTRGIALFKFTLVAGGTFATAILQVIVDHRQTLHSTDLGSALQAGVPTFDTLVLNSGLPHAAAALAPVLEQQSATLAYADSFLYTAILVVVIAPLALIIKPPPK